MILGCYKPHKENTLHLRMSNVILLNGTIPDLVNALVIFFEVNHPKTAKNKDGEICGTSVKETTTVLPSIVV